MISLLSNVLKLPYSVLETSLLTMGSALTTAQRTVEMAMGQKNEPLKGAPVHGPTNIDTAVADFANAVARIARYTPLSGSEMARASSEIVDAAKKSFGYIDLNNPLNVGVPAQMALSFGTLCVQMALRGLVTYEILGPTKVQRMATDFWEMFTELQVFVGLEYPEMMERCRERLKVAPEDHGTRLELGHTLVKCGLYNEAEEVLVQIPDDSSHRARALHEAGIGQFRAGHFARAARLSNGSLLANPHDQRVQMVLWLSAQKLGGYPDYVPLNHRISIKAGHEKPTVTFEDISAKIGVDKTSGGRGMAIFDYDNDGFLDIAVGSAHGATALYHNNGDGTFTDVSVGSGLDTCVNTFAVIAADYDNDGFVDLFITRLGFYCGESVLFHNNGDGTFTDVTAKAGLGVWGPAFTASWIDYDGDGYLDLFIANNLGGLFERKTPNRLFHNNGNGTFTEVTEKAGLHTIWPTIGSAWGDYDNDGRPDLFLSNGLGRSQLYHNNGDGTFTDVSEKAGVTEVGIGSPAFFWDYDNDGWMDIFRCEWSDQEDVIHTLKHGEGPADGKPPRVYHNNRDGTFTMVSQDLGIKGCHGSMSANAADFNNDGYLDLVLGNGSPRMERMEPMTMLEFDGKKFRNITFSAGLPYAGKSHGINFADLFGDGRISMLVASGGAYPGDLLTMGVFCPTRLPGNYVNVRLKGVKSNWSAIGAKIALEAGGRKQYREVAGGSNFGCLPLEQHFGLADMTKIDAIEVRWPSGLRQRFEDVPINSTYEFTEGSAEWTEPYRRAAQQKALRVTAA